MRGVYIARAQIAGLAVAKTVMLGTNPAGTLIELLEVYLTNADCNTVEQLDIGIFLVSSLGSPVGTSLSVANVLRTEGSATVNTVTTWLTNLTTEPSSYNANPMHVEGVLNLVGYKYEPVPEARRFVGSGASFGLRLLTAPVNAFKAECMITYREIN